MAERVYRYGDFPYLFWDADPGAVLDVENPTALCRILERGRLQDVWRLLTPGVIRRNLDQLPLPPIVTASGDWSWTGRVLRANATVVSPFHLRVMGVVGEAERDYGALDLRLEGGTALAAYHLGHRQSADLDFFGDPAMDVRDFGRVLSSWLEEQGITLTPAGLVSQGFGRYQATSAETSESAPIILDIARTSPFRFAAPDRAAEGIRVASYRDLCAGKLHAVCGRFESRDFLDLHAILHHGDGGTAPQEASVRRRFADVLRDALTSDPGLEVPYVAQAIARGVGRPLVAAFPLRLLVRMREEEVQSTLQLCLEECAAVVRRGWAREGLPAKS